MSAFANSAKLRDAVIGALFHGYKLERFSKSGTVRLELRCSTID